VTTLCEHLENVIDTPPSSTVCDQCVAMGSRWVHLRACMTCGQVGCCDQSPNRHARKHWEEHTHQVARSIEPGETWKYCYADDMVEW
jgi:uncharacterized UBP type Zn finger protein